MLFYDRNSIIPEVGARTSYAAALRPGLRAYVVRGEGIRFDTALHPAFFAGVAPKAPTKLSIVLEGELVLRSAQGLEVLLGAGDFQFHGPGWSERWEGARFRVVVIEWDERFGTRSAHTGAVLSYADRERVRTLADLLELRLESGRAASEWAARLVETLRAVGVPLGSVSPLELRGDMPEDLVQIADVVTSAMRDFRRRPSWIDVEQPLNSGARSLRRHGATLAPWLAPLGWPTHWRRTLRTLRLIAAMRLFGSKGATVEQVATATGYGSARALILALHQEGFPTPGTIRGFYRGQALVSLSGSGESR